MIPTSAPAMDKSARWCGVRRSENEGLARRNRVGHKRPPSAASHSALPPDLGRWEKTRPGVSHNAQPRLGRQAGGERSASRECVMAFIRRHRIAVFFVLAYALTWGRPRGAASSRRASCWLR